MLFLSILLNFFSVIVQGRGKNNGDGKYNSITSMFIENEDIRLKQELYNSYNAIENAHELHSEL